MVKTLNITDQMVEAAVIGGAVLGGGGGGWIDAGIKLGREALDLGFSRIFPITAFPDDAILLTVSLVGAPSVGSETLTADDYVRAVELFIEKTGFHIHGLISNEVGPIPVVNGWIQSAKLKIPLVDAPGNGRAHPTGLMGSMGLHRNKDYVSMQTAVGGARSRDNRLEAFFQGTMKKTSQMVRACSVVVEGMVAVARHPAPVSFVKKNGAPGAIIMAMEIGAILMSEPDSPPVERVQKVLQRLGGSVLVKGRVKDLQIRNVGGFDIGSCIIDASPRTLELTFCNEYLTLDSKAGRIATFPDLIMTFGVATSQPIMSADLRENKEVILITAPAKNLILGAGSKDFELLQQLEAMIGRNIVKYYSV